MSDPYARHPDRLGVRIAPELRQRAEQSAAEYGWTLSDWLRIVIEAATTAPESPSKRTAPRRRPGT